MKLISFNKEEKCIQSKWKLRKISYKEQVSLLDSLVHLTEKEIEYKDEKTSKIQINVAGFPFVKRADEYDYKFQP